MIIWRTHDVTKPTRSHIIWLAEIWRSKVVFFFSEISLRMTIWITTMPQLTYPYSRQPSKLPVIKRLIPLIKFYTKRPSKNWDKEREKKERKGEEIKGEKENWKEQKKERKESFWKMLELNKDILYPWDQILIILLM